MRYENFDKVKSIVEQIKKVQQKIRDLTGENIIIEVHSGNWRVMTIGAFSACEHECTALAKDFINDLVRHYKTEEERLLNELIDL